MESGEFRLILALFISFFIIGAIGIVLNVPISEVLVLSVGSVFFELLIHLLTHNKKRGNISFELCFNRYKQFIKKILAPTFFLLLLSIIFVVIDGYKSSSVLFYTHIFVVLFTVGYIICSNNIELHISKKEWVSVLLIVYNNNKLFWDIVVKWLSYRYDEDGNIEIVIMNIVNYLLLKIEWIVSNIFIKMSILWMLIWFLYYLKSDLAMYFLFFGNGFLLLLLIFRFALYQIKLVMQNDIN